MQLEAPDRTAHWKVRALSRTHAVLGTDPVCTRAYSVLCVAVYIVHGTYLDALDALIRETATRALACTPRRATSRRRGN